MIAVAGPLMSEVARVSRAAMWLVTVVASAVTFGLSLWLATAVMLPFLPKAHADRWVVNAAFAGAMAACALAFGAWLASREKRTEPTGGSEGGVEQQIIESGSASGVAAMAGSPYALAVGDNSGLVIGSGAVLTSPVFHLTSGAGAAEHPAPGSAGRRIVVGDIPHEPPAYQQRDDLLSQIDAPTGATGSARLVRALTGMRGAGKTQVAAAYARMRINDGWRLVAWIHAENDSIVQVGLSAVAAELGIEDVAPDSAGAGPAVRHWLETNGERCVLIFDNAADPDALRPFMPAAGGARVLITSTRQAMGLLGAEIHVGEFTAEQALAFLAARTGRADFENAAILAEELGCLPLALAQAAAVIAKQHLDYGTYLDRLHRLPVERLLGPVEAGQYPHGLAAAVLLSLDSARSDDDGGICCPVMDLMSVLSPAGVSRQMMHVAGECCALGVPSRLVLPDEVDGALGRLADSSLLTFSADGTSVSAHRLVTRVVRERLVREGRLASACLAAGKVLAALCMPTWDARLDRGAARDLVQQIIALSEYSVAADDEPAGEVTASVLDLRMWALTFMTSLRDGAAQAVVVGEALLADAERVLGAEHVYTLNTGNDLATAYRASGQMDKAIQMQERVVEASARVLGTDDLRTIGYRSNLANAYQEAGRTSLAITLQQQVLADRVRLLGNDHPDTLTSSGNLAALYQISGRTGEAIGIQERVLADRERILGRDHPDTLASRHNLANAYLEAGRIGEVLPIWEQVVADHRRILGSDHPDTLAARNNLANALLDAGRADEGLDLHERTLADAERTLGSDHPITLAARSSLATAYREAGQLGDAIRLFERAVAGQEQVLGPDHPQTLISRGNLGVAYGRAGREEQGIRLLEQALADQERVLGAEHPSTLNSRGNLANAYQAAGYTDQALPLYEQVLADREQALGDFHPNTLISRGNLAGAYAQAGRLAEAIGLYESTLTDCERILGTNHPITGNIRQNLARAAMQYLP